jgi:hypothetical protein
MQIMHHLVRPSLHMFDVSPKLISHQFGFVSFLLQVDSWIPTNLLLHHMFCYTL